MVVVKKQPVRRKETRLYSIANVLQTGQVEEIIGFLEPRGENTIFRPTTGNHFGYMKLNNLQLFSTYPQAAKAGRKVLLAHAAKFRRMAKELK